MDVRRTQLYRIGVFSDWFGLAHVVDRPKTQFTVRALSVSPQENRPDCTWRLLVRGAKGKGFEPPDESRICWSPVDHGEASSVSATLPSAPEGYAIFNAGNEIDPKDGD